jgi:tripartite-type tricarboxylate transporter receptor subunit TctC
LWAPAGTPPDIIGKINASLSDFVLSAEGRKKLTSLTLQPRGGSPDVLRTLLKSEIAKWSAVVQAAKISAQ